MRPTRLYYLIELKHTLHTSKIKDPRELPFEEDDLAKAQDR